MKERDITSFVQTVWKHYRTEGRHDLAWRTHTDPYSIVVSEIMLQQTQVARVEEYFEKWMKRFPDWQSLADSKLSDVLKEWKGLGYNRRGKYLHDIAKRITAEHGGTFPHEHKQLLDLPGIGTYTAAAIRAFSFNERTVLVETNTRTAIIHHFFKNKNEVSDVEIYAILESCFITGTKAYKQPREWNWALFDYGSWLKKEVGNLNRKSKSYTKQSRFEGSDRQIRSGIVHLLSSSCPLTIEDIYKKSGLKDIERVDTQIKNLEKEGMIKRSRGKWGIVD